MWAECLNPLFRPICLYIVSLKGFWFRLDHACLFPDRVSQTGSINTLLKQTRFSSSGLNQQLLHYWLQLDLIWTFVFEEEISANYHYMSICFAYANDSCFELSLKQMCPNDSCSEPLLRQTYPNNNCFKIVVRTHLS